MKGTFKMITLIILLTTNTWAINASEKLNTLDPYSLDSIEEHFPDSINHEKILQKSLKGGQIQTQDSKAINAQQMIPILLEIVKNQQLEINKLNEQNRIFKTRYSKNSVQNIH